VAGSLSLFLGDIKVCPSLDVLSGISPGGTIMHCFRNGLFCRDPDGSLADGVTGGPDWATDEFVEVSSFMWQGGGGDIIEEGDS
jgi:hypothetical protein